jgi:hypothetical protein
MTETDRYIEYDTPPCIKRMILSPKAFYVCNLAHLGYIVCSYEQFYLLAMEQKIEILHCQLSASKGTHSPVILNLG